jgi:hypothetical protein
MDIIHSVQNSDDTLSLVPAHFLGEADTRDEVAGAARTHKQPVVLYQIPRHRDGLRVTHAANPMPNVSGAEPA